MTHWAFRDVAIGPPHAVPKEDYANYYRTGNPIGWPSGYRNYILYVFQLVLRFFNVLRNV